MAEITLQFDGGPWDGLNMVLADDLSPPYTISIEEGSAWYDYRLDVAKLLKLELSVAEGIVIMRFEGSRPKYAAGQST